MLFEREPIRAADRGNAQPGTDVSDYVAGRLDPGSARVMELRAMTDRGLAAAIRRAKAIHGRVERRLSRGRTH